MKYLKSIVTGMAVFAMIALISGPVFAEMEKGMHKIDKEACAAQIKTLRDSAVALQATNPDLAKSLNDLADKKAEKLQKNQEWSDKHEAKVKLMKDSAAALQATNPALAQELQKMSEEKHMKKEEAGK